MNITLNEAVEDVKIAFQQVEFCIKNYEYWKKRLSFMDNDFGRDMTVTLPNGKLHFPIGRFAKGENILDAANISIISAYGCTALHNFWVKLRHNFGVRHTFSFKPVFCR